MCRDIRARFHKDWFRRSEVNTGGNTDANTHEQQRDIISLCHFFKIRK
jgi:hypothetical protein